MLSILFLIVFVGCLIIAKLKEWDDKWIIATFLTGIFAFIALITLLINPILVKENIQEYNIQKEIYYNLDFSKMSELRKVKLLSKLVELDGKLRGYIEFNKKFIWDLYFKDEDIANIKLVKEWNKEEKSCNK